MSFFFKFFISEPNSIISPIISWPKTRGYFTPGKIAFFIEVSPLHIPQDNNFMRTWSELGFGMGLSTISKGPLSLDT